MAALLPISDEDDFATALALLRKGFPERPEAYWRRGWNRAQARLIRRRFGAETLYQV
jgi:hypothetical protein